MKVILEGPFTDDDLVALARVIRQIDDHNPTALFSMQITGSGRSSDQIEAALARMLPPLPDRATAFARAAYQDDSYPVRDCQFCHNPYRGPAVYCSLDCAMADA